MSNQTYTPGAHLWAAIDDLEKRLEASEKRATELARLTHLVASQLNERLDALDKRIASIHRGGPSA